MLAGRSAGQGVGPEEYARALQEALPSEARELVELIGRAVESARAGHSTDAFAQGLGLGSRVSGYVYHTVPVVIHAWLRHQRDYRSAIMDVVRCGGDTDTTSAILGGIIGAGVRKTGIPQAWLDRFWEWPRTVRWMEALGGRLARVVAEGVGQPALPLPTYAVLLRNALFLLVVLGHGFRRLLPPY